MKQGLKVCKDFFKSADLKKIKFRLLKILHKTRVSWFFRIYHETRGSNKGLKVYMEKIFKSPPNFIKFLIQT